MTLIEISERRVIEAAKAWRKSVILGHLSVAEADLVNAVNLLADAENTSRDDVAEFNNAIVSEPATLESLRPKHPRKLSRREQEIEKRRRSDPLGRNRSDIDYSSIEDPEAR